MNKFYIILFFNLFFINLVTACSCKEYPNIYYYNYAEEIFEGEVLSITRKKNSLTKKLKFRIDKKYKGTFESSSIEIISNLGDGDCGLELNKYETWIIFVKDNKTSSCMGSYRIKKNRESKIDPKNFLSIDISIIDTVLEYSEKIYKDFDENNQIIAEGEFKNNYADGEWKYYEYYKGRNGEARKKIRIINYIAGIQEGFELEKDEDNIIRQIVNYQKNKRNGKCENFSDNGIKWKEGYYKEDIKVGTWISYYDNGKIHYLYKYDQNGHELYSEKRDKNGNVLYYQVTKHRRRKEITDRYEDGIFVERYKLKKSR